MSIRTAVPFTFAICVLAGCASPATEVKVETMSMKKAWDSASDASLDENNKVAGRTINAMIRPDQPQPVVSAPDIRMAYTYQSTDAEGNMHYGNWVAIPVNTFKWLMPEGATVPMTGGAPVNAAGEPR